MKRASNHITRGALPNPISMSPVALFSPVCTEPSRPTRFDLSRTNRYPTLVRLKPERTHFSFDLPRALPRLLHLHFRLFAPSRLAPSGKIRDRIEAEHGPGGLSIECHFSPIVDTPTSPSFSRRSSDLADSVHLGRDERGWPLSSKNSET